MQPYSEWRLQTAGGIKVKVKERTLHVEEENATGKEVFIIRSVDLMGFLAESFPVPYVFLGTIFYPRRRWYSGMPTLTNKSVDVKGLTGGQPIDPFQSDSDQSHYEEFLEVTITYGTAQENDQERDPNDPWSFLEISSHTSGEFLPVRPRGNTVWELPGGGTEQAKEQDIPAVVTVTMTEHTARWPQIPYAWYYNVLVPRLRDLIGKVNDSPLALFSDAPEETIMFMGYSMSQQFTWRSGYIGASPVTVTINFTEKNFVGPNGDGSGGTTRVTHNYFYRPEKQGWQKMLLNNHYAYPSDDLASIFAP